MPYPQRRDGRHLNPERRVFRSRTRSSRGHDLGQRRRAAAVVGLTGHGTGTGLERRAGLRRRLMMPIRRRGSTDAGLEYGRQDRDEDQWDEESVARHLHQRHPLPPTLATCEKTLRTGRRAPASRDMEIILWGPACAERKYPPRVKNRSTVIFNRPAENLARAIRPGPDVPSTPRRRDAPGRSASPGWSTPGRSR